MGINISERIEGLIINNYPSAEANIFVQFLKNSPIALGQWYPNWKIIREAFSDNSSTLFAYEVRQEDKRKYVKMEQTSCSATNMRIVCTEVSDLINAFM